MNLQNVTLVMIPEEELAFIKNTQQEILQQLKESHTKEPGGISVKILLLKNSWQQSELAGLNLINWYQPVKSELLKNGVKFMCLFPK